MTDRPSIESLRAGLEHLPPEAQDRIIALRAENARLVAERDGQSSRIAELEDGFDRTGNWIRIGSAAWQKTQDQLTAAESRAEEQLDQAWARVKRTMTRCSNNEVQNAHDALYGVGEWSPK